jgi:hypothetical protein
MGEPRPLIRVEAGMRRQEKAPREGCAGTSQSPYLNVNQNDSLFHLLLTGDGEFGKFWGMGDGFYGVPKALALNAST